MNQTIFIIDDTATFRQMTRAVLSNAGYNVLEAEDGQKGLDTPQHQGVDLILTDESGDDIENRGRTAGATGWLVKPFNIVQLLTLARKILG